MVFHFLIIASVCGYNTTTSLLSQAYIGIRRQLSTEAGTTQTDTVCKLTDALMTADINASGYDTSQYRPVSFFFFLAKFMAKKPPQNPKTTQNLIIFLPFFLYSHNLCLNF